MTTLVTGATGFVGSAVARRLLARGHRVCVLARGWSRNTSDFRGIIEYRSLKRLEKLRLAQYENGSCTS